MRITHRMLGLVTTKNMQRNLSRLERFANQLSTGKAFTRPSQEPVGCYKVMRFHNIIARNDQYTRNVIESNNWMTVSEAAIADALDTLQRIRELTVDAANDTKSALDRLAIAPEILQYREHLLGVGNTQFNQLYIFAGWKTLQKPYELSNFEHMYIDAAAGIVSSPEVEGLQQGEYRLAQDVAIPAAFNDAVLTEIQSCLHNGAANILGSGRWGAITGAAALNLNASVLLEVDQINRLTGEVTYRYHSHQYDRSGVYNFQSGLFTLTMGGADTQLVTIGGFEVAVDNLAAGAEQLDLLQVGDRAVLNLQAAQQGAAVDRLQLDWQYRSGSSSTGWIFDSGTLDASVQTLRFYTLEPHFNSHNYGRVYDSAVTLEWATAADADPALSFFYDEEGFPVYCGDDGVRRVEVSAYQEVTMNFTGNEAFKGLELFDAVRNIYRALVENDGRFLGGDGLADLDKSIDHLLQRRAEIGARMHRTLAVEDILFHENLNVKEISSKIEDIDLAAVMTEYMMQETVYQASLATTARLLQPSLVDYMR